MKGVKVFLTSLVKLDLVIILVLLFLVNTLDFVLSFESLQANTYSDLGKLCKHLSDNSGEKINNYCLLLKGDIDALRAYKEYKTILTNVLIVISIFLLVIRRKIK